MCVKERKKEEGRSRGAYMPQCAYRGSMTLLGCSFMLSTFTHVLGIEVRSSSLSSKGVSMYFAISLTPNSF